jgi:hypothetical protein
MGHAVAERRDALLGRRDLARRHDDAAVDSGCGKHCRRCSISSSRHASSAPSCRASSGSKRAADDSPFPGFRLVVTAIAYVVVIAGAAVPEFVTDASSLRRFFDHGVVAGARIPDPLAGREHGWSPGPCLRRILESPRAALVSGSGRVEVEAVGEPAHRPAHVHRHAERTGRLRRVFSGWTGVDQIEPVDGLLGVMLEQGQAARELTRPYFRGEREGLAISLVTWAPCSWRLRSRG